MSVLAEFIVPANKFVLADTLTAVPEIRIEIKRVVGGTEYVTPYFWAAAGDLDAFERALREDEMTREVLTLEENQEDERFYRVTWETPIPNLIDAVSDAKATILEAVSDQEGRWELKVLFPDRGALSAFHDYCLDHDFSVRLERVYWPENPQEQAEFGVTEKQQEALMAAFDAGYFEVPRDHSLTEVAGDLGISRNALSARLRRGHRNLLANTLVHDE